MSLLISVKEAEFIFIKEKTNATAGNLSVQVQKLKEAGYIDVVKEFKDNYPNTTCEITKQGIKAFEEYVNVLQQYLNVKKYKAPFLAGLLFYLQKKRCTSRSLLSL